MHEYDISRARLGSGRSAARARMDKPEALLRFNILFMITGLAGLVMVLMMGVWTAKYRGGMTWSRNPALQFNWHPLLNTLGMIYLSGHAILVYRWMRNMPKQTLKLIHAAMHFTVLVLTVIAGIAVLDSHNLAKPPIPNFYSLHSWLGIVTIVIYLLQWIFGIAIFMYPGFPLNLRGAVLPIHTFMGLLAFVLAIATAFTGLTEKALYSVKQYSSFIGETYFINILGLVILLFGALVVHLATEKKFKRFPRPEDVSRLVSSPSD